MISVNCSVMSWTEEPGRLHSLWGCSRVIKITKSVQIGIAIKFQLQISECGLHGSNLIFVL